MLLLEHQDVRLLFTGDINTLTQATIDPVLCPPGPIDVLIMEHTYGIRNGYPEVSRAEQEAEFLAAVDAVLRRGGSVVVPAFAVGRAQEVLCLIAEHGQQTPDLYYEVYVDGLARSITTVYDLYPQETTPRYQSARGWIDRRLNVVSGDAERDAVLEALHHRPGVIVASSGMLKAGSASHYYARALAGDPANAIFLTGYVAEDSEAAVIYSSQQDALDRLGMEVCCEVRRFHFTAHAPHTGLLDFVHLVGPRSIFLVHGDADRSRADPGSVYNILLSEGFDIHLGRENVPFTYRGGRLSPS
jgi:Cft2 family RNA processing exonuclease